MNRCVTLDRADFDAVIFDLDGVLTRTARVHAAAWKEMFDAYLEKRGLREGRTYEPFDAGKEYRRYVDGKPRYDGVKSFLASRGIELPWGEPQDPSGRESVCGLGNRKNEIFGRRLASDGVEVFAETEPLLRRLREAGIQSAVVSSSRNCAAVLEAAELADRFEARVDGVEAARLELNGKPAPDYFLEAARRLGVAPARTVVVEDAEAGVEAGRRGEFGLVVGVARTADGRSLQDHGADVVISDLGAVQVETEGKRPMEQLPAALGRAREIAGRAERLTVFLDYDGTLTPIVERPEQAVLSSDAREAVRSLAERCTVAVVSGRDRKDVEEKVGLENLVYAGSHGFDIRGPQVGEMQNREAEKLLPVLARAEEELEKELGEIPRARLERKKFSIAVHFREVAPDREGDVGELVDRVLSSHSGLRKRAGKKIFELQPDVDWDKGRAVLWLLEALGLDGADVLPLYIGDDVTDEDAFRALRGRGVGVAVRDEPRPTWAAYALEDPQEVRLFLQELTSILEISSK